jgi:transposase
MATGLVETIPPARQAWPAAAGASGAPWRPRLPLAASLPGAAPAPDSAPRRGKGRPHGSGLGKQRWVVERTLAWLHQHRRFRIRYERRAEIHKAFVSIACSLICLRALEGAF